MKPKLALFTTQLPALDSGTPVRNFYLLNGLTKTFDVSLYCFLQEQVDENKFKQNVHENTFFYYLKPQSPLQKYLDFVNGKIPYVEYFRRGINTNMLNIHSDTKVSMFQELNTYFVMEKVFNSLPGIKILDAHNIEYIRLKGELVSEGIISKAIEQHIIRKIFQEEKRSIEYFDGIFTTSDVDAAYYQNWYPNKSISVIPNGVNCDYFSPSSSTLSSGLLFMGLLSYPPNANGIRYFIEQIFPLIKQKNPHCTLTITGKGAQEWLKQTAVQDKYINLTGFVPDVRDIIKNSAVCICPLLSGSGTRLKILEYMAMGKAIVSTSRGAEGIKVCDKEDILLADTSTKFADCILHLLSNTSEAESMGQKARELVQKKYSWSTIQKTLVDKTNELIKVYEK